MLSHTFYLEASSATQDLLTTKWTLKAAGYGIGSIWHEREAGSVFLTASDHWNKARLEQLKACDSLVILSGNDQHERELAMMAGFALAWGLKLFWIGSPLQMLTQCPAAKQFATVGEFEKYISKRDDYEELPVTRRRLAA